MTSNASFPPGGSLPAASSSGSYPHSDPSSSYPHLVELGWDDAWGEAFARLTSAGQLPGRVVAAHRQRWLVAHEGGERAAVLAGRLRFADGSDDVLPTVGDWVVVDPGAGGEEGVSRIAGVLPRRSAFRRGAAGTATRAQTVAANVDLALVVTALSGDLNPRRLERYLALAWESGALPLVVLSKAELCTDLPAALAVAASAAPGVEVLPVSAVTGEGIDRLVAHLRPGRTAVLLGSSGVGKSTLANALLGEERLRTGSVRDDGKGRHTTTHRELLRLAGGALLIDTPGMREVALWGGGEGVDAAFGDVDELARGCRFGDCRHEAEPGCAVGAAVREGRLDPARLESWHTLRRELAYLERRRDEAAASEARGRDRAAQRALRAHLRRKRG